MMKRILFASDFSPASGPAFALARRLARALHARLILIHAYERVVPVAAGGPMMMPATLPPTVIDDLWAEAKRTGQRGLDRLAAAARRDRLRVAVRLEAGPPAAAIVRTAKRERAGLVVLGTHGRTGLPRLLLGSVAERVVRIAPCPVLTVPRHRR